MLRFSKIHRLLFQMLTMSSCYAVGVIMMLNDSQEQSSECKRYCAIQMKH